MPDARISTQRRTCLSRRSAATVCLLGFTVLGSIHVAVKVRDYNDFTRKAFQVMNSFSAASATDSPKEDYAAAFAALQNSDRALGKMMAIAYTERVGSLSERDTAIVDAANALHGKDLYRLLLAAAPLFNAPARERYFSGSTTGLGFPGVDMMMSTLTMDQRAAMNGCFNDLEPIYGSGGLEGRIKIATTLYVGTRWEGCTVPKQLYRKDGRIPIHQTI